MRVLAIVFGILAVGAASPGQAQSAPEPSARVQTLATRYVELLDIEGLIQDLYASADRAMPEWQALQREMIGPVKGQATVSPMPSLTQELDMDALRPYITVVETLLVETYARTYDEDQLQAMIRFASSRRGDEIRELRDEFVINLLTVLMQRGPEIMEQFGLNDEADAGVDDYLLVPDTPEREMRPAEPMGPGLTPGEIYSNFIVGAAGDAAMAAAAAADAAAAAAED